MVSTFGFSPDFRQAKIWEAISQIFACQKSWDCPCRIFAAWHGGRLRQTLRPVVPIEDAADTHSLLDGCDRLIDALDSSREGGAGRCRAVELAAHHLSASAERKREGMPARQRGIGRLRPHEMNQAHR